MQYQQIRNQIEALGQQAVQHSQLEDVAEIIKPLAPLHFEKIAQEAMRSVPEEERRLFHTRLPEEERPRHLAMLLNRGLADILCKHKNALIFGEDVGKKGGVYHVTADLQKKAGLARVFNTPLDETAILGLAIGSSQLGMLAIPEIQYLAYLHNAIDQIRGEACSMQFFSNGQFKNPMVVRIASYAYQKGFGGHFHNDNSIAALRDIPGLVIASPSNGHDAVLMLRTCVAAAEVNGGVSVFLEPIALYMTKDLHEEKDGLWLAKYPSFEEHIPIGESKTWTQGTDCTIFSYANGLWMSLRVAKRMEEKGISCRVVDIRWLNPLPEESIIEEAKATGRVLVVDECRRTGGMAEPILALLAENCSGLRISRITGVDTYIPLGDAANRVLIQEEDIELAIQNLMEMK
jgi:2-oxoisovalerate dehydrogenase E1 component